MKTRSSMLTGAVMTAALMTNVWAVDNGLSQTAADSASKSAAIESYMNRVSTLNAAISDLNQRIETTERRRYQDPKGFKRAGWNRLLKAKQAELESVEQRIADLNGGQMPNVESKTDNLTPKVAPGNS